MRCQIFNLLAIFSLLLCMSGCSDSAPTPKLAKLGPGEKSSQALPAKPIIVKDLDLAQEVEFTGLLPLRTLSRNIAFGMRFDRHFVVEGKRLLFSTQNSPTHTWLSPPCITRVTEP